MPRSIHSTDELTLSVPGGSVDDRNSPHVGSTGSGKRGPRAPGAWPTRVIGQPDPHGQCHRSVTSQGSGRLSWVDVEFDFAFGNRLGCTGGERERHPNLGAVDRLDQRVAGAV